MDIDTESASALEDVIQFYKDKGIEVKTPVKIIKGCTDDVMKIDTQIKGKKGISQPQIMDMLFSYELFMEFLGIKTSKEKMIEYIIRGQTITNGRNEIEKSEILYGDQLKNMLAISKEPKTHFRTIISHEIWHLIEHEKGIYSGLISEGTATYAMTVYGKYTNTLDKTLEKAETKGIRYFKELTYDYCAALVKQELDTSKDIRLIFDKNVRKKIATEYKKHVRIHAPKIFSSEIRTAPWIFRGYLNQFFGIQNNNDLYIKELEDSGLYKSLTQEDKNKITNAYKILQQNIHKKK